MLHLDDAQLYDLSEAGPLLFKDPVRLGREARIRAIPSARVGPALGLPAPWVDAEAGRSQADAVSLATYWLGRLAPPALGARKPLRSRAKLPIAVSPAEGLLTPAEAAAALFATQPALERLEREGRLPSMRIDGDVRYDKLLVDLMAAEADGPEAASATEARRADVRAWARFEYTTTLEEPRAAVAPPTVFSGTSPKPAEDSAETAPTEAPETPDEEAPRAYEMPSDLLEIDGFETLDED